MVGRIATAMVLCFAFSACAQSKPKPAPKPKKLEPVAEPAPKPNARRAKAEIILEPCKDPVDPRECPEMWNDGAVHQQDHNYPAARAEFFCAYEKCRDPISMIMIAKTYEEQGDLDSALAYSEFFLELAHRDHKYAPAMVQAVGELRKKLGLYDPPKPKPKPRRRR
jgi:hypothetical protein